MAAFDPLFDGINDGVEALFSVSNIALWLAFALFAWCAGIVLVTRRRHYAPLTRRLEERLDATAFLDEIEDDAAARLAFAERFAGIDAAMAAPGPGGAGLRHAWSQFRGTLLDAQERPLRATVPPEDFFLGLGERTRVLAWWANIFVAIGLTFTFLGIIAALLKAVRAMGASADPATMQAALVGLLHITAAKFWTSIGGVASSIVLRVFDRRWHSATQIRLERLCDRLERGTLFTSPQQLALVQLRVLEAIEDRPLERGTHAYAPQTVAEPQTVGPELAAAARALSDAADRIAAAVGGLERRDGQLAQATSSGAATLTGAAEEVQVTLVTLGRVAGEMAGIVSPVRDGTRQIAAAAGAIEDALRVSEQRVSRSEAAMTTVIAGLEQTSAAASRAWESYRDRFEAVDTALARALQQIETASATHAGALTGQVASMDSALGRAVDRLAQALDGIGDLVAALDDMRGELRARRGA